MAVDGLLQVLAHDGLDHFLVVAVDKHLDALVEELVIDLLVLQGEHALLARDIGEADDLLDQLLRAVQLEDEGPGGDLEGAEELGDGKLDHHHQEGAAKHDQQ